MYGKSINTKNRRIIGGGGGGGPKRWFKHIIYNGKHVTAAEVVSNRADICTDINLSLHNTDHIL